MISVAKACMLLAFALISARAEIISEDCGDTQHDVETGMLRLPDFSGETILDLNCSWIYTAPAGRKFLIKVDSFHLPHLELRTSVFQMYVDDVLLEIPRNCVDCLRKVVEGKVMKVVFTSHIVPIEKSLDNVSNETSVGYDDIGSFQIRFKAFDPYRCVKPEQIENGHIVSKGRKIGESIFYHCNAPYTLLGSSELNCTVSPESLVPTWNEKTPTCTIPDCTGETVVKRGSHGAIASPGYPTYTHHFIAPCIWEIIGPPHQQIKVIIKHLTISNQIHILSSENGSRLSLIDEKHILNLTNSLVNPVNFLTSSNKLTIHFIIQTDSKYKEENGFYIEYSFVSNSCPQPKAPENGEVVAHSIDLNSVISYTCKTGYILIGEFHAKCLFNRQWSHPAPSCKVISGTVPFFISSSNDSDTVLPENQSIADPIKYPKTDKKKDFVTLKDELRVAETSENVSVPRNHSFETFITNSVHISDSKKKSEKDGLLSERHLSQVIPPKEMGKKYSTEDKISKTMIESTPGNSTIPSKPTLPALDKGYVQEIIVMGFKLNLMLLYIIAGAGVPIVLILIVVVSVLMYRRRYPVRMRFGRKFSTFENPMYVQKDAHHPRELKKLTT